MSRLNKQFFTCIVIFGSLLITGCSMAPVYKRPDSNLPKNWDPIANPAVPQLAKNNSSPMNWEEFVVDDNLKLLIKTALINNRDLRQTVLNVEAAQAQFSITRADRLPGVNLQGNGSRQSIPADLTQSGKGSISSTWSAGSGITSFELDLFGRVKSLSDAALQEYLSQEDTAESAKLSLITQVIEMYLTHDGALRRLALTEKTLDSRESSLALIKSRRSAGTASEIDYQDAVGLVEQARTSMESTLREVKQAENALVLLSGVPNIQPDIPKKPNSKHSLVQDIIAGMPSELLTNRPDIKSAEHTLKSRNASIGAARAAFFPRISLTGLVGTSSSDISNLFNGGQESWSFSPQITLPIFSGGRNMANLNLANVRKDIAVANYEKTIQTAFREVADALTSTDTLFRQVEAQQRLTDSSKKSLILADARYRAGVDDYLRYLDSERNAFNNDITLINLETQRQIAIATLYKSIGGGWKGK